MTMVILILGPQYYEAEESLYLLNNVDELIRPNKELKDKNDELDMNMLSIPIEDW